MKKPKIVVCLFRKEFQGGSHSDYVIVEVPRGVTPSVAIEKEMERWGEKTAGGHNYGYTTHCAAVLHTLTPQISEYLLEMEEERANHYKMVIDQIREKISTLRRLPVKPMPKYMLAVYDQLEKGSKLYAHVLIGKSSRYYAFENGVKVPAETIKNMMEAKYLKRSFELHWNSERDQYKQEILINL